MITPRLVSVVLLLGTTFQFTFAQGIEKVLVKSFNLNGLNEVVLEASGPVEVKTWDGDLMRIQMTVHVDQCTESMLKSLVEAGRYNLSSEMKDGRWAISTPGMQRDVLRNGQPLQERVSYLVFAPANVHLEVKSTSSAGLPVTDSFE